MNRYIINIERPEWGSVSVTARDENEAREKFWNHDYEIDWDDTGDVDISSVDIDALDISPNDFDGFGEETDNTENPQQPKILIWE